MEETDHTTNVAKQLNKKSQGPVNLRQPSTRKLSRVWTIFIGLVFIDAYAKR